MIHIPVSVGELIDKVTILGIKMEKIVDTNKLRNINFELNYLNSALEDNGLHLHAEFNELYTNLYTANLRLWMLEDDIRELSGAADFGDRFITTAKSIHEANDLRMKIKGQINQIYKSAIVEEKSYKE
jgi:hypothetical protein